MPAMDRGNIMRGWENKEPKQNLRVFQIKFVLIYLGSIQYFNSFCSIKLELQTVSESELKRKRKVFFKKVVVNSTTSALNIIEFQSMIDIDKSI